MAWSGGKDSALALREIQGDGRYRVAALLTTVTAEYDRISMHGVRRALLRRQAECLGLPLVEVLMSPGASNDEHETTKGAAVAALRPRGPGAGEQEYDDRVRVDLGVVLHYYRPVQIMAQVRAAAPSRSDAGRPALEQSLTGYQRRVAALPDSTCASGPGGPSEHPPSVGR